MGNIISTDRASELEEGDYSRFIKTHGLDHFRHATDFLPQKTNANFLVGIHFVC